MGRVLVQPAPLRQHRIGVDIGSRLPLAEQLHDEASVLRVRGEIERVGEIVDEELPVPSRSPVQMEPATTEYSAPTRPGQVCSTPCYTLRT